MKKGIFILPLFFSITAFAQQDLPEFGKVAKADLEMKECDFDKGANAVVLFDIGKASCDLRFDVSTQMERHVRIKILNKKGFDYANIHIPHIDDLSLENIKGLTAQTINLDASGNILYSKVEKDAIYKKQINKRYAEVIFTFPNVQVGSIIEYKYKIESNGFYAIKNWYFQKSIPVNFSSYTLDFPYTLKVSAIPKGSFEVNLVNEEKDSHYTKTFSMHKVPALNDEPYITCNDDYLEQLTPFMVSLELGNGNRRSLVSNWIDVVKDCMNDEDFGVQLKKDIPRTTDLEAQLANINDEYTKMTIIHNYVKTNMQWDGLNGIWALNGVKSAWKNKKGTAGEINLILVNLLKTAGLNAHPVLVSTRDNGRVNVSLADYYQFNKVMAYVVINDKVYVIDATDKYNPTNLIPYDVVNSQGLVIEKADTYDWGWRTLWNTKQIFNNTTFVNAEIDDKGIMEGTANITSIDYSRYERIAKLKEGVGKFTEAWLNQNQQNITIDSLVFTNENVDTLPLIQDFKFKKKINASGDFNYFSANLFSGLDKNPFIADERFSDVFYGADQRYSIIGQFTIPDNYQFEALPKNLKMSMPDTSIVFTRNIAMSDNQLSIRIIIEFKKPYYLQKDYDYFKEFYKKMFEYLNEQFVFKKK